MAAKATTPKPASASPTKPKPAAPRKDRRLLYIGAAVVGVGLVAVLGAWLSRRGSAPARQTFTAEQERPYDDPAVAQSLASSTLAAPTAEPAEETLARRADALVQVAAAVAPTLDESAIRREARLGRGDQGDASAGRGLSVRPWEMQFSKGHTLETYARMLDFFGFELGAVMPEGKIIYAYNLSKLKPDTRPGQADKERRFYFTWSRGDLVKADHDLYSQAGVDATGRVILCFAPPEIEGALAEMEKEYAGPKAANVVKTRFGIRARGDGYEFYVIEQQYK